MSFTGEYNNIIDQKNRLSIPAKYRKSLDIVNGKTFVLTKGFDQCLFLYPVEEWKTVEKQLSSLSTIKGKNRSFIRSIVRYANYVKYDSQGRIQIPEILLNYSKIEKNVSVGPYARLREGTVLKSNSKIGNFVETKKSNINKIMTL